MFCLINIELIIYYILIQDVLTNIILSSLCDYQFSLNFHNLSVVFGKTYHSTVPVPNNPLVSNITTSVRYEKNKDLK